MKRLLPLLLLITVALCGEESVDRDQLSVTLGHLLVRHLGNSEFELNIDKVIEGIRNEQQGIAAPLSEDDYERAVLALSEQLLEETSGRNLAAATAFLEAQNGSEGICSLEPNRLHYRINKAGEGAVVPKEGIPLIRYHGTLLDGTTFAASAPDEDPIALPLKHTIPGFAKGLEGMHEGEKRTLYVHPELAYGVSGHLPPNSLLIFEVEVVQADSSTPTLIASEEEEAQLPPA